MADEMLKAQVRVVNYLINFLKNTKEKRDKSAQTVQYLEARIKLLERYYSDLFTRHESLLPFATEKASHEYFAKDAFMFAEEAYVEALAELSADVERLRTQMSTAQSTSTAAGRPGVPASATIDHVKVPRVSLPTFTGKQTEWESYKQRFSSLIKNKSEYSDVDKLQYLLSTVEGKAAERLRGLEVTGANFKVAWDKLTKRYDNVRKRLASHLDALINLPAVRSKTLSDLEKLMDGVEVAVRGLQDLGYPIAEYDNWFVHCVARKLDAHTRETWEISQESKEGFFKYADLIDFLDRRLISLDQTYGQSEPRSTIYSSEKSNSQNFKKLNSTSVLTARVEELTFTSNNYSISCCVCQGKHPIHTCAQFKQMSPQDRFSYCKKEKLCLNCLRKGHTVSECKSSNRCLVCKQAHHTKLHFDSSNPSSSQKTDTTAKSVSSTSVVENSSDSACGAHFATASRSVLLATAKLLVCDRFGNSISARALIDPGAQRSFVTERLAALLQAEFRPVSVSILGVGGQVSSRARGEIPVELKSRVDANFGCFCTALVLCEVTCLLPAHKLPVKEWSYLKGLQLADPAYSSPAKIDLILGADLYSTILLDGLVRGPKNAPIAQKTTFGLIPTGAIHPQDSQSETSRVTAYHVTTDATSQALVKFWEIEELPSSPKLTAEEYCDQYFLSTYSRNAQGRFVVCLLFSRREPFPDSRDIAVACLRRSERRQLRDVELQQAYSAFMQEYVELGHMEVATKRPADSFSYYMPHHGVFRADSRKIRVVFNASQKTSSGYSLNDILLTGRKLQQDITLIILRWRFHQLAIATDIVKMFRQFLVHRDVPIGND